MRKPKAADKLEKVRIGVYIPKYQADIAEQTLKNKSQFVEEAIKYFIDSGQLKRRVKEIMKEAQHNDT